MEAQVFEQQSLTLFQFERHFFGFRADTVRAEADVFAAGEFLVEQHAQAFGNRLEAHLRIGFALRTAEMGGQDKARAVAQSVFDGGQGFADAGVVHDAAIVEWDVEIDAHEDAMIVERTDRESKA